MDQLEDHKSIIEESKFKRVCVFCGSSSGKRDCYRDAALELGQELVSKKIDLVYGGGSIGLMGIVSQEVHRSGGHVLGIIPKALMRIGGYGTLEELLEVITWAQLGIHDKPEYVPLHEGVVAKAKWEVEQVELNLNLQKSIAR
ncbi:hypothetical protein G4B88_023890 [Cannabis sativa]|uniref:cytokinin riboside 5'-monophosphate phosphoribohydrolase n=1 Tax=Cannabis sativa TaxID=3483 RepID=A0A7J6F760_CANSA|nr:hypothetical protein G4B88_023890 [Cannabis sativa]